MQYWISHFGYFGVFGIVFIEAIGFPLPSETTLTLSGIEWTQGLFNLVPLWLAGSLGNIVGSTIAYGIGRFLGRPILLRFGKYIGITEAKLDKADSQFQKYGLAIVIIGKFIAFVRIVVPYLAGINRMKFWLFWPFNAVFAILWSGMFIIAGHYIGVLWDKFAPFFHRYLTPSIIVACLLVAAFIYWKWRSHRRKKRLEMAAAVKTDMPSLPSDTEK